MLAIVVLAYLNRIAVPSSPRDAMASGVSIGDEVSGLADPGGNVPAAPAGRSGDVEFDAAAGKARPKAGVEGGGPLPAGSRVGIAVFPMVYFPSPVRGPVRNGGPVSVVTEAVVRGDGWENGCLRR